MQARLGSNAHLRPELRNLTNPNGGTGLRKVRVLMLAAAVVAAIASTPGTSSAASTEEVGAKQTASVQVSSESKAALAASCPSGTLCLYAGKNQTQFQYRVLPGNYHPDFRLIACDVALGCTNSQFDNDASSWVNNTSLRYCVSQEVNGGGLDNSMPPGTSGNFTSGWDNVASSLGYIGCP